MAANEGLAATSQLILQSRREFSPPIPAQSSPEMGRNASRVVSSAPRLFLVPLVHVC